MRTGITMMIMKTIQTKTNREFQAYIREILPSAYWKTTKTIMSCDTEEQLEVCLRMIEHYERLMQNSYLYPTITPQQTKERAIRLYSLLRIKRKAFLDF